MNYKKWMSEIDSSNPEEVVNELKKLLESDEIPEIKLYAIQLLVHDSALLYNNSLKAKNKNLKTKLENVKKAFEDKCNANPSKKKIRVVVKK